MNELDSSITYHHMWESWMIAWVFQEGNLVKGYSPDNTLLNVGKLTDLSSFFEKFESASIRWHVPD